MAFSEISHLTFGNFRNWLLADSTDEATLSRIAPGITPEMAAAVSKLMRNQNLVLAASASPSTPTMRKTRQSCSGTPIWPCMRQNITGDSTISSIVTNGAAFRETQRLGQELVRASRENEFCLHYQPQFDLKSGRIIGIEALPRWRHPTRGMLAAAEFIEEAERTKLMPAIGEWTLQTACSQHKKWIDSGLAVPLTLNL